MQRQNKSGMHLDYLEWVDDAMVIALTKSYIHGLYYYQYIHFLPRY